MLPRGSKVSSTASKKSVEALQKSTLAAPIPIVTVDSSALPTGAATDTSVTALKPTTVTFTHSHVATGAATVPALASNSLAKYRLFQNTDGTNAITIAFNVAAVINQGITIPPNTSISFSVQAGNLDTRVVNCIANAGTPNLAMTEGV